MKAPTPPPSGDLLDLGCGTGAIALTMARRAPGATVWAIDVNARARDLCARERDSATDIDNVRVVHPDEVPDDVRFDGHLEQPADPDRQAGAARSAAALAPAPPTVRRRIWSCRSTSAPTRCSGG